MMLQVIRDTTKVVRYSAPKDAVDTLIALKPKPAQLIEVEEPLLVINTDLRPDFEQLEYICEHNPEVIEMVTPVQNLPVASIVAYPDDAVAMVLIVAVVSVLSVNWLVKLPGNCKKFAREVRGCITSA